MLDNITITKDIKLFIVTKTIVYEDNPDLTLTQIIDVTDRHEQAVEALEHYSTEEYEGELPIIVSEDDYSFEKTILFDIKKVGSKVEIPLTIF